MHQGKVASEAAPGDRFVVAASVDADRAQGSDRTIERRTGARSVGPVARAAVAGAVETLTRTTVSSSGVRVVRKLVRATCEQQQEEQQEQEEGLRDGSNVRSSADVAGSVRGAEAAVGHRGAVGAAAQRVAARRPLPRTEALLSRARQTLGRTALRSQVAPAPERAPAARASLEARAAVGTVEQAAAVELPLAESRVGRAREAVRRAGGVANVAAAEEAAPAARRVGRARLARRVARGTRVELPLANVLLRGARTHRRAVDVARHARRRQRAAPTPSTHTHTRTGESEAAISNSIAELRRSMRTTNHRCSAPHSHHSS